MFWKLLGLIDSLDFFFIDSDILINRGNCKLLW